MRGWVDAFRATPNIVIVAPGACHWDIFICLLEQSSSIGNLVADA